MTGTTPSPAFIRDLYARMLFTRIMDDYTWKLHTQGFIDFVASCRGHEAAQVGSAVCIEVGKDFTLPYYRDLGVVLTIGMTPHEVFRTYLQNRSSHHSSLPLKSSQGGGGTQEVRASALVEQGTQVTADGHSIIVGAGLGQAQILQAPVLNADRTSKTDYRAKGDASFHHWGYHKHNTVTGPAPVATQLLHAAGIAFACKLRKVSVVTVAYCGGGATTEPDFLEGLRFAALHRLPVIFVCEHAFAQEPKGAVTPPPSCLNALPLPGGLIHRQIDGADVVTVYQSMQAAMQYAREGRGPILVEMYVTRPVGQAHLWSKPTYGAGSLAILPAFQEAEDRRPFVFDRLSDCKGGGMSDPLVRCQHYLEAHGMWDDNWANQLCARISAEIECAWYDVLHDILQSS